MYHCSILVEKKPTRLTFPLCQWNTSITLLGQMGSRQSFFVSWSKWIKLRKKSVTLKAIISDAQSWQPRVLYCVWLIHLSKQWLVTLFQAMVLWVNLINYNLLLPELVSETLQNLKKSLNLKMLPVFNFFFKKKFSVTELFFKKMF